MSGVHTPAPPLVIKTGGQPKELSETQGRGGKAVLWGSGDSGRRRLHS